MKAVIEVNNSTAISKWPSSYHNYSLFLATNGFRKTARIALQHIPNISAETFRPRRYKKLLIVCCSDIKQRILNSSVTQFQCQYTGSFAYAVPTFTMIQINQPTNQMHQSLSFISWRLNTAQHVSGIFIPIIRSLSTAVAASALPLERGGSRVVGRGRPVPDRPRPTTRLNMFRVSSCPSSGAYQLQ